MNLPLTKLQAIEGRVDTERTAGTSLSASGGGIVFQSVAEAMEVAKLMALSDIGVRKHLRGNPGACLGVVIQAVEWGMSPYAVANKSYLVNDQLAYESQLVQAVILRRAPIKGRIKFRFEGEGDQRVCFASALTLDGDVVEYESPKFGRIGPKNSPLWKNDPDQQHAYYSGRGLCRRHFPDVLLGIYDREEMEEGGIKDVTPPPGSGFAARLSDTPVGGFDPAGVETAIGEAVEGDQSPEAVIDQPPAETPSATAAEPVAHDADAVRAGGTACVDGEVREAPEDFTPEQAAAWLAGYDETAAAIGGRQ